MRKVRGFADQIELHPAPQIARRIDTQLWQAVIRDRERGQWILQGLKTLRAQVRAPPVLLISGPEFSIQIRLRSGGDQIGQVTEIIIVRYPIEIQARR